MARNNPKNVDAPNPTTAAVAEVIRLAEKLAGEAEKRAAREAELEAEQEERRHRREHPAEHLTDQEIRAIVYRLSDVLQSCYTINRLALDSQGHADRDHYADVMTAVAEMARANVKGLDACIEALDSGMRTGLFEGELALE